MEQSYKDMLVALYDPDYYKREEEAIANDPFFRAMNLD